MLAQQGAADEAVETMTDTAGDVGSAAGDAAADATDSGFDFMTSLEEGADDLIKEAADFLPKLAGFLLILIIGTFVAKLIGRVIKKAFKAINLDAILDRAGIGGPLERAGYADSGKFVAKVIYYAIMLLVLKLAFGALGITALNEPFDQLLMWIPKALVALVLLVVGGIVANIVKDLVGGITHGQAFGKLATSAAGIGTWLIFGLAALDQAEIASNLVDTITNTIFASLGAILVIKYGVGGIWSARDRFWPAVYDSVASQTGRKAPAPERN